MGDQLYRLANTMKIVRKYDKKILAACIAACIAVISPLHVSKAGLFKEFSIRDEKELAKEFEILVKSRLPIIEDPEIKSYVRSVVDRIIAKVPPQTRLILKQTLFTVPCLMRSPLPEAMSAFIPDCWSILKTRTLWQVFCPMKLRT